MPPNETAPSFTDEDRARANEIVENIYHDALYHPARFEIVGTREEEMEAVRAVGLARAYRYLTGGNRLITRDEGENR